LAVPRYYFHIRKGDQLLTDDEGMELSGHEEARQEARRTAGEMLRDGTLKHGEILEVMDSDRNVVLHFKCADVEEVEQGNQRSTSGGAGGYGQAHSLGLRQESHTSKTPAFED
jgi:hypothetical protein